MTHKLNKSVFEVTIATEPPLEGTLRAKIYEGDQVSNQVIRIDQEWTVRVNWELTGALVPCICGYWCLTLFMESIGPGEEFKFPREERIRIPLDPCGDGTYSYDIVIPAHTIKEEHCSIPYKPVVALTYLDYCERPGPMAGFCELPLLQFYRDEKQTEA
jgi:hypothetical protein